MILKIRNPKWKDRWEYFEKIEEIAVAKEDYCFDGTGGVVEVSVPSKTDESADCVVIHRNFATPQGHDPNNRPLAVVCFCKRAGERFTIAFDRHTNVYLLNDDGKTIERL